MCGEQWGVVAALRLPCAQEEGIRASSSGGRAVGIGQFRQIAWKFDALQVGAPKEDLHAPHSTTGIRGISKHLSPSTGTQLALVAGASSPSSASAPTGGSGLEPTLSAVNRRQERTRSLLDRMLYSVILSTSSRHVASGSDYLTLLRTLRTSEVVETSARDTFVGCGLF